MKPDIIHVVSTPSGTDIIAIIIIRNDLIIQNGQVTFSIGSYLSHLNSIVNLDVSDCEICDFQVIMTIAFDAMLVSFDCCVDINCHSVVLGEYDNQSLQILIIRYKGNFL
jgi:hypothetical protein